MLKISEHLLNSKHINFSKENEDKININLEKNKIIIKLKGETIYFKYRLSPIEKKKFFIAKYDDNFKKLILKFYKIDRLDT